MTRIAVLSDIHANLPALEAVTADLSAFTVDQVIVAGDSINSGPFSVKVLEYITRPGWSVIRGNHEFYLLNYGTAREPGLHRHFTMPRWLNHIIPANWKAHIAALPDTLTLYFPDAEPLRIAHGVPDDHNLGIYPHMAESEAAGLLSGTPESTVVIGHTHLPLNRRIRGTSQTWRVINPGSVGLPLDGNIGAAYAILESRPDGTWRPTFRRVAYDAASLFAEFERIGYVNDTGVVGRLLIAEFETAHYRVVPYYNWHNRHFPQTPDSLALVEEFLTLSEWQIVEYLSPYARVEKEYQLRNRKAAAIEE